MPEFKVISLNKLKELDLGEEFIREIVETFVKEIPQYLTQAEEAFQADNTENLRRILHTLKSHSNTLCMSEVNQKLIYWETNIQGSNLSEFETDFVYLKKKWNDAMEDLRSLVNGEKSI